jgi:predicted metal-dependent peptidase
MSDIQFMRLQDPHGLLKDKPEKLKELQAKITNGLTNLCKRPENGGNPFLFCLLFSKPHKLFDKLHGKPFKTAFTNGKIIGWNPDFLEALDHNEVVTVMMHEIYHVLFMHCQRMKGKKKNTANIAMDYSVNNHIEVDHSKSKKSYELWGQTKLGEPVTLDNFLNYIDGKFEDLPNNLVFVDRSILDKSPEEIYDIIMDHRKNSPRRCKVEEGGCDALSIDPKTGKSVIQPPYGPDCCPKCGAEPDYDDSQGGSFDEHTESDLSKEEILGDILKASAYAKSLQGTVPKEIETLLGQLLKPQLRPRDIIRNARLKYQQDQGDLNDYKRLRRRGLSNNPTLFQWKKKDYASEWVAMIDTSGSMSDDDIANGIKELQLVAVEGKGWVVPCDAVPHWKSKVEINSKTDLLKTRVVGRGGTVFTDFFRDLPKHFPEGYDTVVVITDGDVGPIPVELRPRCDVVWVITNERTFQPSFGRVCQLTQRKI